MVTVLFFGSFSEKAGASSFTIESRDIQNLKNELEKKYGFLSGMPYIMAVNQVVVKENLSLQHGDEVAIMPPFAGG